MRSELATGCRNGSKGGGDRDPEGESKPRLWLAGAGRTYGRVNGPARRRICVRRRCLSRSVGRRSRCGWRMRFAGISKWLRYCERRGTPEAGSALPRQESACQRQAWVSRGDVAGGVIRAQIATRMWQRIRRRFGQESGRRVRVTTLTRRCRASAWMHERPGQTEKSRSRLLKPQRHAIGLADRLHLGVFALRPDQIRQQAVYVYAF
jgi:hypothetical protein